VTLVDFNELGKSRRYGESTTTSAFFTTTISPSTTDNNTNKHSMEQTVEDAELQEIMKRYSKPVAEGSALSVSDQKKGFEAVSDEEEIEEEKTTAVQERNTEQSTPIPSVAQTVANGGVPAIPPPDVSPATPEAKKPSDKEALAVIKSRFEDLWKLEVEHETLKHDFSDTEQAKQEVERQRAELQKKSDEQQRKIEELTKLLEEEMVIYPRLRL